MNFKVDREKLTSLSTEQLQAMANKIAPALQSLLEEERVSLDQELTAILRDIYIPIADWLVTREGDSPQFVGINGAQGSGKSTLCKILSLILHRAYDLNVVTLSIDDLYLRRNEREALANSVHPLLLTRGVPGTHDMQLGEALFSQLKGVEGEVTLPCFDKATDDRSAEKSWPKVKLPVDMVLFEGWCVATKPEADAILENPVNELEEKEDANGKWRHYVNEKLANEYQQLFDQLHTLVMLQIPSFDKVIQWRSLQEKKLREQKGEQAGVMDEKSLKRFIMHYERLTKASLQEMPARAGLLLKLNDEHQIESVVTTKVGINGPEFIASFHLPS